MTMFKRRLHGDRHKDPFMDVLVAPYAGYQPLPGPSTPRRNTQSISSQITVAADEEMSLSTVQSSTPQGEAVPINPVLHQSVYRAVGEWAWTNDLPIRNTRLLSVLDSREGYELGIKTGTIGTRVINYISKTYVESCTSQRPWSGFLPEVVLYKQHLRPLQGNVVPALIQVTRDEIGRISLIMAPPHPSLWIQASADMPEVLKEHCVAAVQKLHEAGVWHGDLLPSNVWLGGDGKVTIINFHKSRALTPCPRLGLFAATPADLDLEMRKFKWILDYRTTRIQEDLRFIRCMKRFRLNQERERAPPRRDIPPIEKMAQEDITIPPLNPTACIMQWLPRDRTVARFIMPDQTPDQFVSALRQFLENVEALKHSQRGAEDNQLSKEPSDNRLSAFTGSILSSLGQAWSSSGLASLCRKRRRHEPVDTEGPIRKRIRFAGVPENEDDEDAFKLPTDDDFGPGISFSSADDPTGVTTRLKIVEANITQCTRLGLPHPDSIEQDPGNPRWLDPDVTEYLKRQERDRLQVEQACLYVQGAQTRVAPQRILRSAGRLQRTLRAISQPSSLLEPLNSGPSRKRGRHDDSDDLLANSQRPGKARRYSTAGLDDTSTRPNGNFIAKLHLQRNPGRPTTLKNIHRRSGPGYQLRLRVKRIGREPPVPLSCIRVGKSGPTEMSSGSEPPYIGSSSPSLSHQVSAGDLASGTPLPRHGGLYLPSSVISRWLGALCRLVLES